MLVLELLERVLISARLPNRSTARVDLALVVRRPAAAIGYAMVTHYTAHNSRSSPSAAFFKPLAQRSGLPALL